VIQLRWVASKESWYWASGGLVASSSRTVINPLHKTAKHKMA
jgi:hypothetical protein